MTPTYTDGKLTIDGKKTKGMNEKICDMCKGYNYLYVESIISDSLGTSFGSGFEPCLKCNKDGNKLNKRLFVQTAPSPEAKDFDPELEIAKSMGMKREVGVYVYDKLKDAGFKLVRI